MGFSTTKTTQLKSVGDAVQIVALIIGGTIILNVPNCTLTFVTIVNITNLFIYSAARHGHCGQHSMYCRSCLHGLPAEVKRVGSAGQLLAG